ncbi:MAG: hypothetical protein ABDH23_02150 [Endomicrobiia bacterium]
MKSSKTTYLKEKTKKPQRYFLPEQEISQTGKKIIIFSVILLTCGFILLKFTNPEGNNWASVLSPFIIIISYILIGMGIMAK